MDAHESLRGRQALLSVEVSHGPRGERKMFEVPVVIEDVRQVFGRTEYLVAPVGGAGAPQWVNRDRVTLGAP